MAGAQSPAAPAPPPPPVPEKRVVPGRDGGEEERPEPKRRRACVAALDGVPCAASVDGKGEEDGRRDGSSFSFHHAGGGFVALETTPKFGFFNPPAAAEREAPDPKPAPPSGEDSPQEGERDDAASVRSDWEGADGNSLLTAGSATSGRHE